MDYKNLLIALNFSLKENAVGIFSKKYQQIDNYCIEVNIKQQTIDYGNLIVSDSRTTLNFTQDENFVVLECVNRLLEKGYKPENIILEKTYPTGHESLGKLNICVTRDDGSEYLLIECKTYGKEYDKAFARMKKDGGQLFTYFKFSNKPDIIMLYTSELKGNEVVYHNEIVKIEDDYRTGNVKDFYERWNKLTKDNGIFDGWVKPYHFESKALTPENLKEIKQEDSSLIFNQFLEILRHNVISDKPNAFNKIFTLFLCKIFDEKNAKPDEELAFQWFYTPYKYDGINYPPDTHISFQKRLTDLYKKGMRAFLEKEVTDISDADFARKYSDVNENIRKKILDDLTEIRLKKNNEFAIKEVFDDDSFDENAKVIKEVVELLQGYKIRYVSKQQYLSDFFELLLTTGLKQESGQFFTPVPVAQFIIKSLPIDNLIQNKLQKGEKDDFLPHIIDYASGSGHFITESMHELQCLLENTDSSKFLGEAKKFVEKAKDYPYNWAYDYIYGIEKDYRLVKVGKVGCYLHGDGLARVIHSDGLGNFTRTKEYQVLLTKADKDFPQDNKRFDIVVSNPPYSVSAFKNTARKYYSGTDFELYDNLTDNSSEIECLFVERTKQLLIDKGVAGIILPSSILNNEGIYTKVREIILQYFEIIAITELGNNTFMATGTNTVVLFLRRRNNYDSINLKRWVEKFFHDLQDVTPTVPFHIVEKPVTKYVNHVWEGITFDDYVTLLKTYPNETIKNHELYREYDKNIKAKTLAAKYHNIIEIEKEKLYYFILAYSQKNVVLVMTGEKDEEKRFLGYEFSNRRGNEGIHPIQRGKTINECTKLFDAERFDNPQKASTYIYKAFNVEFPEIDTSLKNNISRVRLIDMLTFDRASFTKNISTTTKRKIKIENKWDIYKIKDLCEIGRGRVINKKEIEEKPGEYPVYSSQTSNNGIFGYLKTFDFEGEYVTWTTDGIYAGSVFYRNGKFNCTNVCGTLKAKTEAINMRFLSVILPLFSQNYVVRVANPKLMNNVMAEIQILLPPKEIQQKIVAEIEIIEKKNEETKEKIEKGKAKIEQLFAETYNKAYNTLRLSDDIFNVSIGKRVVESDLNEKGSIPVYSANVFKPFGYIDKYLIDDFSVPSILWGIDGDWKVNYMPENKPFYPTDHCGVLRCKTDKILPKYLAWILNKEGLQQRFSRTLRASIDRIKGLNIKVPPLFEQQKIVAKIEALENQIAEEQKIIDDNTELKNSVLNKYLFPSAN